MPGETLAAGEKGLLGSVHGGVGNFAIYFLASALLEGSPNMKETSLRVTLGRQQMRQDFPGEVDQ